MNDGFLLIDKEVDWTSRDVCNKVSHILNTKKVGHSGTLDPFATGLLVVAVGKACKFIPFLESLNKTYIAELTLGNKTDTADSYGKIIETKDVGNYVKDEIIKVLSSFKGKQFQIPPMTSAISINGERLYKLAHRGQIIERPAREIEVFDIQLLNYSENRILFICKVSKGTYIRTLGEDIAEKLGTVGHLTGLRRINVSDFTINNSVKISEVDESKIISINDIAKSFMKIIKVNLTYINKIKNGLSFEKNDINFQGDEVILFVDENSSEPVAIYHLEDGKYKCLRGLWA